MSLINYAVGAFSFVLPMNSVPHTMEEWIALIGKSFDLEDPRNAAVVADLRSCPAGTTITRKHGDSTILEVPA